MGPVGHTKQANKRAPRTCPERTPHVSFVCVAAAEAPRPLRGRNSEGVRGEAEETAELELGLHRHLQAGDDLRGPAREDGRPPRHFPQGGALKNLLNKTLGVENVELLLFCRCLVGFALVSFVHILRS